MNKEIARRNMAGDIEAFGVHNIDNLAEFLIDRGWSLDRSRETSHDPAPISGDFTYLSSLVGSDTIDIRYKLDVRGREEWLYENSSKAILRKSRRKYDKKEFYDLPTYVITQVGKNRYRVFGAGLGPHGKVIDDSITHIRGMLDRLGLQHAVDDTEEYKVWRKL